MRTAIPHADELVRFVARQEGGLFQTCDMAANTDSLAGVNRVYRP